MKKIFIFCLAVVLSCAGGEARAFETPVTTEAERQMVKDFGDRFLGVATSLGCDTFSWGTLDSTGQTALLEYIPKPPANQFHDPSAWTRKVTVTVYGLTGDKQKDLELMVGLIDRMMTLYKEHATIVKSEFYEVGGEPAIFLQLEGGEGAQRERTAGVFMRVSQNNAALMGLQLRGRELNAEDITKIRALLPPGAKR